jgi:hypothetical protein
MPMVAIVLILKSMEMVVMVVEVVRGEDAGGVLQMFSVQIHALDLEWIVLQI